jgi:hypothetical protein
LVFLRREVDEADWSGLKWCLRPGASFCHLKRHRPTLTVTFITSSPSKEPAWLLGPTATSTSTKPLPTIGLVLGSILAALYWPMRLTIKTISDELAKRGHTARLAKAASSYFYFETDEAADWLDRTSTCQPSTADPVEWMAEIREEES